MSDNIAAWGARDEGNNMWWPQGNNEQQQQYMQQQLQQQQINIATSQQQQMFNYKMASTFQNQNSNADNSSPVGAQGMRGYDFSGMTGGNPQLNAPAQGNQWWYPPSTMDNMQQQQHGTQQQSMTASQSPSPQSLQSEAQSTQEQQEANRHHQEAIQQHHQAIAEAQARHQQLQQQTQQLQHQLQQQQQQLLSNHHQQILQQPQLTQKGRMPRAAKGGDMKPRGRMTAYAFFVQTCREEHKKKHPEENVVFAEFSKKCAERWKTMSDKEKKRFHAMADTDKKRYDTEMQGYTPPKGEKQRGKKRKQIKDPNAPKRSLSAFFHFSNEERSKVKGTNPEWGVGDVAKELGRRWADSDPETRARFEAMADKDKARYEKEMTAYKKKNEAAAAAAQQVPEEEVEDEEEEEDEDD